MITTLPCPLITNQAITAYLARLAIRALYFELKAYPKPGLVSFVDAGAHQDMNGKTFYDSLFTLRHYFLEITRQGMAYYPFKELKQTAMSAEQKMLLKTQGVNTHRGAIFALGLIGISAARLLKASRSFTPYTLQQQLLDDWSYELSRHESDINSHGSQVRQNYYVVDARQMAMRGYDIIFQLLPDFITLFTQTNSINICCLDAYLQLLLLIDDTNILYRKGRAGLDFAQNSVAKLLSINCLKTREQQAIQLHQIFSQQSISPGGVADLIAVLLFISQLFYEPLRCHY